MSEPIMFPIALDLGAANTGVFALTYPAGSSIHSEALTKIAFTAKVPATKAGGYSLLQTGRTQKRHIRRCQTRNRQAKRLFALIMEKIFGFNASIHQEAIAELMNRRGYSYVDKAGVDFGSPEALDFAEWLTKIESETVLEALSDLDTGNLNQSIDALFEDEPSVIFELEELINEHGWTGKGKKKSPEEEFAKNILGFAKEQTKGTKHRRKFFDDITDDLKHYTEHPSKAVRRLGHELHQHKLPNTSNARFMQVFIRVLCHVSNLELKTLNAMLPQGAENQSATLLERNLTDIFGRWILKQWQTSDANGKSRLDEIKQLRSNWKAFAEQKPGQLFDFWLQQDPSQTIPPYQNHTNRRPPSCQTLILNPQLLDEQYQGWRQWLDQLDAQAPGVLAGYKAALMTAVSKKDTSLANDDEAAARSLQFLLDANQKTDPFGLNAIWSKLKKAHENQRNHKSTERQLRELGELLQQSVLPESLKDLKVGEDQSRGSFWHLINRYYQTRRRTRDGRYFLHYDNSLSSKLNRWQRDGNLLVMCPHRPRQLKHQALQDVLALWGMTEQHLRSVLEPEEWRIESLDTFLFGIKGLKTHCKDALTAQKQHGVNLSALMQTDSKLGKLQHSLAEDARKLATKLFADPQQQQRFVERNSSLYQFAQLYALVWEDRSGFGKTCPLCSVDNAQRMQPAAGTDYSRASRLNTLSMRLIDGGLKRLLNHQAHHIANRLWTDLEPLLSSGNKVSIPLILEQNRFDFTDNLYELKGQSKPKDKPQADVYEAKKERIVDQGKGLCPYPGGNSTSLESHELDHIIPRTGPWGVLNDEANLICASRDGNRHKGNRMLTLAELNPAYLKAQFGTANTGQIIQNIEATLLKPGTEQFVFGQYRQFLALSAEQQTAFRHALFLPAEHPLRQQVIDAIQHRQKARVNGTQRYMAQLLADIFWQKARKIGADKRIEFDYFEISSNPSDENSTVALRRILEYVAPATGVDLMPYKKKDGISQKDYSHVIDAICAMTLAIDAHQGEGALRLNLPDNCTPWSVDESTGEILPGLFGLLNLPESECHSAVQVKPQGSYQKAQGLSAGGKPDQLLSRSIHTENAYGLRYYDLAMIGNKLLKGWYVEADGAGEFIPATQTAVAKSTSVLDELVEMGFYQRVERQGLSYWQTNTSAVTAALFEVLSARKSADVKKHPHMPLASFVLSGLYYCTSRKDLITAPVVVSKLQDSPQRRQWHSFLQGWQQIAPETLVKDEIKLTPVRAQAWSDWCDTFLKRNIKADEADQSDTATKPGSVKTKRHKKQKLNRLSVIQTLNGSVTLVARKTSDGKALYQLMPMNNNNIPKENLPALVMQSPNMVWFDKDVLKKGYTVDLQEREDISGSKLDVNQLIKPHVAQELELPTSGLMAVAKTPAKLMLQGIPKSWFEQHLLEKRDDGGAWLKRKSLDYSHKDTEKDGIKQEALKQLLEISPRTDKTVAIVLEGEQLTLTLEYKKGALDRFVLSDKQPAS